MGRLAAIALGGAVSIAAACVVDIERGAVRQLCDEDVDCPSGLHCSAGECVFAGADDAGTPIEVGGNLLFYTFADHQDTDVIVDRSGWQRHGDRRGPDVTEGRYGLGYYFEDGAGDNLFVPDAPALFAGSSITIEAWLLHDDRDEEDTIYGDHDPEADAGDSPLEYSFAITEQNVLRFSTSDGCGGAVAHALGSQQTSIPGYEWVHVAVTWDGRDARFYLDGALADTVPLTATPCESPRPRAYLIGRAHSGQDAFQGILDELKVSDYVKSEAAIAASMAHDSNAAGPHCGNGVVEWEEVCDGDAPCCASCEQAAPASPCAANATCTSAGLCDAGSQRATAGLVALYTFDDGGGALIGDSAGVGEPLDLVITDPGAVTWGEGFLRLDTPTWLMSVRPADTIYDAVTASGAVSVEAWVVANNGHQGGPARIASLSNGPDRGNLMLGQVRGFFVARFRSRNSTVTGSPASDTLPGDADTELRHVVFTRDASGLRRLYVDGRERSRLTVLGGLGAWEVGVPLSVGNEPTLDRPWLGELHRLAVYDRALAPLEVQAGFLAGP